jgi:hypothetical protein
LHPVPHAAQIRAAPLAAVQQSAIDPQTADPAGGFESASGAVPRVVTPATPAAPPPAPLALNAVPTATAMTATLAAGVPAPPAAKPGDANAPAGARPAASGLTPLAPPIPVSEPVAVAEASAGDADGASAAPATLPPSSFELDDASTDGSIKVRFAAAPTRFAALVLWRDLNKAQPDLLSGRTPLVRQESGAPTESWSLGTGGFSSVTAAEHFCDRMREHGQRCTLGL